MVKTTSALPVEPTRSASLRPTWGTRSFGGVVPASTHAVGRPSVGVTAAYQGTAMPSAGRARCTDLLIDVDGPSACAPPD